MPSVPEGEKVKPQHGIVLVLLISLIACAAAAGDLPPALPHEFYGNMTIDGSPAPAGTVVTAMIGGTAYGSIGVVNAGGYGDPDWNLGSRLLVTAASDLKGETITFLVDGAAANQTAPFTPGRVTRLDLSIQETATVPTARFTANVTSGPAPLTVAFTDTSTGDPTSWSWTFGDGTTSAERSPTHTYTTPGTYTANLTVVNAAGSDSTTATITVREIGAVEIVRGPYLTGTTTTATFINWMAQEPVAGTVEYADDAYYAANGGYALSVADTAETAFHRVALENLTPDTLYHYRIVAGNTTLGDHTFRTFPEDGGFTFIVYGDTQLPANIKIVADRIADEDPLFILHTGDQVNAVESVDEWNNFFSSNRRLLANTTIYTTLGNHEYNDTVYYETFGLPQWYSFVCADAHFAVLDDNFASNPLSETAWLAQDLSDDTTWKFVANHHPPYSSTSDRAGGWILLRQYWGQIMKDNGVTAVFNGHIHAYERYLVDGITYLVTGTGAGSLHPLGPANERPAGYQNSLVHTLGYTKITIHDNGTATGQFIRVARLAADNSSQVDEVYPPGTVFETYTLTPRARGADLAAVSLDVPAGTVAGNACTVNGTIKNLGGTVVGACSVTLAADGGLIGTLTVGPLAPGETAEVSFTWAPASAGDAALTLAVDPAATVPDIDRTNNNRTVTVTVTAEPVAPVANFTAAPTDGAVPLTVAFTDLSTSATAWSWTFGDGATSTEQHPAHTYTAIGRYNVTLTTANGFGSDTLTRYHYISVRDVPSEPAQNETGYPLHDNGTTVTTVGGQQQVTFNATAGNGTVSGNDILLSTGTLNVTIQTDGLTGEDGNLTGNVTGVLLESSQPVTADLDDVGNVSIAFNASMNGYNPDLTISTSIYDQPSTQASTAFTLAAADGNLEITSTAYAVYFTKANLGANDTISNAVLQMTVSPAWVAAHGGVDAIRVFRQGDDGVVSILETTYLGLNGDGMMVFEAISPNGFSAFAVAATNVVATPTQPPASGGGGSGGPAAPTPSTSTGTADLLTSPSGTVLQPYLVYVDGNFAHLSLKTGVTALDGAGNPLSGIGIAPVSTLPSASSLAFSGYAVDCSPAGATFAPAIDLVFTFTGDEWTALLDGAGGDSARLVVQGYDAATGAWTACPTSVNAAAGTVTASISHFSTYALFIGEPAEAPVTTGPTATVPAAAAATTVPTPPAETGEIPLVWIALAVLIAAALVGGYVVWKRR